jgi:hypothetical protein
MKKPSVRRKKESTPQMLAPPPEPEKKRWLGGAPKAPRDSVTQAPRAGVTEAPRDGETDGPLDGEQKGGWGGARRQLDTVAKPFKKLAGQSKSRIVVWGLLAVIVVIALLTIRGGRDDEALVRDALARYEKASAEKDVQTLCDELFASSYVRQTASSGLPCEVALRTALAEVRNPMLDVLSVEVNGDRALARVRGTAAGQVPGESNYTLVRENDSWRILPPRGDSTTP